MFTWYYLCPEEQKVFESTAIYLMPTWDQTSRITLKHLKTVISPYAGPHKHFSYLNAFEKCVGLIPYLGGCRSELPRIFFGFWDVNY